MSVLQKFVAMALLLVTMVGCGDPGGTLNLKVEDSTQASSTAGVPTSGGTTPSGNASSKSLISIWTEFNNYFKLDLRSAKIGGGAANATVTTLTGQNCTCAVQIIGSETAGSMVVANCAGTYPDCASFNSGRSSYTKSAAGTLQICDSNTNCMNLR